MQAIQAMFPHATAIDWAILAFIVAGLALTIPYTVFHLARLMRGR